MAQSERITSVFRDARIIFRNFKGEEKKYNRPGDRNISLMLTEDVARAMLADGWNVKPLKRQEEDEQQYYHLPISVQFANKPPRIWLLSNVDPETGIGRSRTMLGEGMVGILDDLDSTRVDLTISGYDWNVSGNSGRKAYLQSLFFTMYEDELEREYADIPQVSVAGDMSAPLELEPGARQQFDYEGVVVDEHEPR